VLLFFCGSLASKLPVTPRGRARRCLWGTTTRPTATKAVHHRCEDAQALLASRTSAAAAAFPIGFLGTALAIPSETAFSTAPVIRGFF
jgi:hypothetical protein